MRKFINKILIIWHAHAIRDLETSQDIIIKAYQAKMEQYPPFEQSVLIEEATLMIQGLARQIAKHQHRIETLEAI